MVIYPDELQPWVDGPQALGEVVVGRDLVDKMGKELSFQASSVLRHACKKIFMYASRGGWMFLLDFVKTVLKHRDVRSALHPLMRNRHVVRSG